MTAAQSNSPSGLNSSPIEDDELEQLFQALESHDKIALGVSGGPDSMALMHLLARWRRMRVDAGNPAADILVMTVDHGLRAASQGEAVFVGEQAKPLGFDHMILPWLGDKPGTGVQDGARRARYQLMITAALEADCTALVVAHHAQDQAETLLMRLARGSGVDGLAGMRPVTIRDGIELHRPFLDVSKARLKASLEARDARWIEDPSNEDDLFERIRVRKVMALLEPLGVSPQALARSAGRLNRARLALEDQCRFATAALVTWNDGAYGEIDGPGFFAQSLEIRLRVLGDVISAFGGRLRAPQLSKLETFLLGLDGAQYDGRQYSGSLGGAVVRYDGDRIYIFREPLRGDIEPLPIVPGGASVMWDGRFEISLDFEISDEDSFFIAALGEDGLAYLKSRDWAFSPLPREALLALPALKNGNMIVAVPHLDFWQGEAETSISASVEAGGNALSATSMDIRFISGNILLG